MFTLSTICDIQLGHTARTRLEMVPDGTPAIQLRDTPSEGGRVGGAVGRYDLGDVPARYWAKPGDVLFRSRGDHNTAAIIDETLDEPAVAVMPLVILRPDPSRAVAQFLAWYINQPDTQRYFDSCARGTGIRMIPVGCLADLAVPLPALDVQRSIGEVDDLAHREFQLASRLIEKRRQLTAFALLRHAKRFTKNDSAPPSHAVARNKTEGAQ